MKQQIIECVPNISEGRDLKKINLIAHVVTEVEGIKLLDIDPEKQLIEPLLPLLVNQHKL